MKLLSSRWCWGSALEAPYPNLSSEICRTPGIGLGSSHRYFDWHMPWIVTTVFTWP
eukprot:CAMPEP_0179160328 /NCGR_PEP_ID=MMETSP0796-20121207/78370_1 /TAXON_ID=73915 /ORGANISM="Pyrodinium bahamense, Strain pbaha01" /LENGTH=55 /DNA_ID=CAMNT_0020862229 /DNA_START=98 /DNA_END=261 /DNA_ORIENTATION=+